MFLITYITNLFSIAYDIMVFNYILKQEYTDLTI